MDTTLATASRVEKWDADFFAEYVRANLFKPYMGRKSGNAMMPIVATSELTSGGKTVNIPLITALNEQSGVRGTTRLIGNEAQLGNYNQSITVNWNRNGVTIKKPEEHWTEIDLRNAGKAFLRKWASSVLRNDLICAMLAFDGNSILQGRSADDTAASARTPAQFYAGYAEATKDAWVAANSDRFLFGSAVANNVANDHADCLATIDNTSDKLTTAGISLAKELAKATVSSSSETAIHPFQVDDSEGREFYVLFANSRAFRDLKRDTAMTAANRDARTRGTSNPIFKDGDLEWDGVIIREIPEIPVFSNGTIDVGPNFLCGAQAVGLAWGQEPKSATKAEDDYGFEYGVAIEECRATAKLVYQGKQHGMVTYYTAAVASA